MAEPFDDTAKAFYRSLFQNWGMRVETECEVYARSRRIDLVVDCSEEDRARLESTVFRYFLSMNALEFKGPADPLTLVDYNLVMMRGWGLGAMRRRESLEAAPQESRLEERDLKPEGAENLVAEGGENLALPANRTVSIICVIRPDHLLDDLGEALDLRRTAEPGIYINGDSLSCRVIVPSELPLEERYYPLLPLARGRKLREFIELCIREGRTDYLRMALDVGLVYDPEAVWRRVMEVVNMQPVWTDEVYEIIDSTFRQSPELLRKFPTLRQMLEESERQVEVVRKSIMEETERQVEVVRKSIMEETERQVEVARQDGELKARQEDLLQLMSHKFGELPAEARQRVENTRNIPTLKQWLDRLLEVNSLEEMGLDKVP